MNENTQNSQRDRVGKLSSARYAKMREAVTEVISQTRWEYYDTGSLATDPQAREMLAEGLAERVIERLVLDEGFDKIETTLSEISTVINRAMTTQPKQSDYAKQA